MTINLIASIINYKNKLAIGYRYSNELILKIKKDLEYFKNVTSGNIVVMGYNTWMSLYSKYRPLPNRLNIVLTNDRKKHCYKSQVIFTDYSGFKKLYKKQKQKMEVYVIGGGEIYNLFMNENDTVFKPKKLYITEINNYKVKVESEFLYEPIVYFPDITSNYNLTYYSEKFEETINEQDISYRFLKYSYTEDPVTFENDYLNLIKNVNNYGKYKQDRTNTGTLSLFGQSLKIDISESIPLLTTKHMNWKNIIEELLWFLRGDTDTNILKKKNINIWNGNSTREFLDSRNLNYKEGVIGPCFPENTTVFTKNGFKYIQEITKKDKMYSTDSNYDKINIVMKRQYSGEIITLDLLGQPEVSCTPEHPFYCKRYNRDYQINETETWCEAKMLKQNDLLGLKINDKTSIPIINYVDRHIKTNDIYNWFIFGLFVMSGRITDNYEVLFEIDDFFEINDIIVIKAYLNYMFDKVEIQDKIYKCTECMTCDIHIFKYLEKYNNKIPYWVYSAPKEYIVSFVNGIIYANHKGNYILTDDYTLIKTYNKDLAYGIQNLSLKIGTKADVYLNKKQEYEIVISDSLDIIIENGYAWFKVIDTHITNTEIPVNVYNFEVANSNTYTVQNLSVHNCYGWQWRYWGKEYSQEYSNTKNIDKQEFNGIDQIKNIIYMLKNEPNSRRIVLNAWNVSDLDKMALPPCHLMSIFNVETENGQKYLNCHLVCRSTDIGLGLPYNLFSYSVLVYILAMKCDMLPGKLYYTGSDVHIYSNHLEKLKSHFNRTIKTLPKLHLNPDIKNKEIEDITIKDFDIIGYYSDKFIKMDMAV